MKRLFLLLLCIFLYGCPVPTPTPTPVPTPPASPIPTAVPTKTNPPVPTSTTVPVATSTPKPPTKPTATPPAGGKLEIKTFPASFQGKVQDYKMRDGLGYALLKEGATLRLYTFDGTKISGPEVVTHSYNGNSEFFMTPRVAMTSTHLYVGWGVLPRRTGQLTLMKRPISGGNWTSKNLIDESLSNPLRGKLPEQFNMEGLGPDLYILAFDLSIERLIFFKEDGRIVKDDINLVSKAIRTDSTESSISFFGRFRKVYSYRFANGGVIAENLAGYIAEPSGMDDSGSPITAGWTDFVDDTYPTKLALLTRAGRKDLLSVTQAEGMSTGISTGVLKVGGKVYVVYDVSNQVIVLDEAGKKTVVANGKAPLVYGNHKDRGDIVISNMIISMQWK